MPVRLTGILGGTFDPVHYGHLKSARYVMREAGLDELRLIPGHQPVHREAPVANAEQRLAMLRLALHEFPEFVIDERELRRGGPSYTYDTLTELRREYPDVHICLLMGLDAFKGFTGWYRWPEILELAHVLVMIRPGYGLTSQDDVSALLQQHALSTFGGLRAQPGGGILSVQVPAENISSTAIRERLRHGQSVQGLLPSAVEQWLRQHPVYSVQQQPEPLCN
jgi:nicotinate-nucleotide adenylyltransferase